MTKAEATNLALDFLARNFETLASLAWPLVALSALMMFKSEIAKLLPLLRVKHGDSEVSFAIANALQTEAAVSPEEAPVPNPQPAETTRFERLLSISPYSALMEMRYDIEEAMRSRLARVAPEYFADTDRSARYWSSGKVAMELQKRGAVSDDVYTLIRELVTVGNMAIHARDQDVSERDARNYRRMADRVIAALSREGALVD